MRARRGFTMWEMAIVLAVMAVAAALVIPAIGARFGEDQPPVSGQALMKLLNDSRKAAVEGNQTIIVRIDPITGKYQVDSTGAYGTGVLATGTLEIGAWESLATDLPRLQYFIRPTGATLGDSVLVRGMSGSVVLAVDPWSGVPYTYAQ